METKRTLPKWLPLVAAASIMLVIVAAIALWRLDDATELPRLRQAPAFSLIDQEGRTVSSDELKGKAYLVSFIYTNCTDICPVLTMQMRSLQTKLQANGLLGTEIDLLSITVDPDRDTPPVLASYAEQHQADTATWRFLTGDLEQIRQVVVDGFLLGLQPSSAHSNHANHSQESYEVTHSGRIALVDPTGQIRAYYDGTEMNEAQVIADIQGLLR